MAKKYSSSRRTLSSKRSSSSGRKRASYRKLQKYSSKKYSRNTKPKKGIRGILDNPNAKKIITIAFAILGVFSILGVVIIFALLARYTASLPNPAEPFEKGQQLSSRVYDRNETLLYTFYGDEHREIVTIDNIAESMKWAILAAEDIDYLDRKTAIDIPAFLRAIYFEVTGTGSSGFSGITQQMLRNTVLSDERTYERKIKEVILTMQVESRYSKEEILQLYLNEVPFGGNNYGIKAAANSYFGKEPKDLTLAESALLAGLPQAPSYYSPVYGGDPEAAKSRQEWILDQMLKHGDKTGITEEDVIVAKAEELIYKEARTDIKAPHFVFYVKQLLEDEFGYTTKEIEQGGLDIHTSLDYDMQKIAEEEIVANSERLLVNYNAHNASLVTINPNTGEILAMVGSKDYWGSEEGGAFDGKVNVATALRQPGSSVKPYTYVTAFEKGMLAPSSFLPDVKIEFPDYEPKNWDDKFYGPMNVRLALQLSRNIPAIKAMDLIGIDSFIETAEKLGITTFTQRDQYGLSLTLGAADVKLVEHTAAYGVFATGGIKHPSTAITKIVNSHGETEYEYKVGEGTRVMDPQPIFLLNSIMGRDNCYVDSVHARQCIDGYDTAGKTGTSNENRNLWFVGYSPDLVTGVWAGNNDNTITTYKSYGSLTTLPIWHDYMARVLPMTSGTKFERPSGIVTKTVCKASGQLATENCSEQVQEYFIDGMFPPEDKMHQKVKLCKDQGLLATEADELSGNVEEKIILRYQEIKESWQPWLDQWMDADERKDQYEIPTEYCEGYRNPSGEDLPWVVFDAPEHKSEVKVGENVKIEMRPISPYTITKVQVYFDDDLIDTITSIPYEVTFKIPSETSSGTHEISAKAYDSKGKNGSSFINVVVDNPDAPSDEVAITSSTPPELTAIFSGDKSGISGVYFYYELDSKNTLIGQGVATGTSGEYATDWEGLEEEHKIFAVVRFKDPFEDDIQSEKVTVTP